MITFDENTSDILDSVLLGEMAYSIKDLLVGVMIPYASAMIIPMFVVKWLLAILKKKII